MGGPDRWWRERSSTRSTSAASPTATATASATSPASARRLRATCATSASTPIWFSPWYPSPMADGGYDVADYRDIDPAFGTLAEAEALIAEAHALGMRIIVDIVPNHCSDAAPVVPGGAGRRPGSAGARAVLFRRGAGRAATSRPTTGVSVFGGPAWTRVRTRRPGQWYLHLFAPEQPDFNWDDPRGPRRSSRTSCGSGSTAASTGSGSTRRRAGQGPALPDAGRRPGGCSRRRPRRPPALGPRRGARDLPRVAAGRRRATTGAAGLRRRGRGARPPSGSRATCAPTSCTPRSTSTSCAPPWDAAALRQAIDGTLAAHAAVGAPATWVLSNHDVTRHVTRYGRPDTVQRRRHRRRRRAPRPTWSSAPAGPGPPRC